MSMISADGQPWVCLDPQRALEQIGDEQAMRSMLPMLLELLERDLPQIEAFLAQGDVHSANGLLHSLKGCMPIFCETGLCDALAAVEQLSKTAGSGEVSKAYGALSPKLDLLRSEVIRFLA